MLRTAAKLSIAAVAATLFAGTALAQNYTFKFQSSDPAGNPNFVLQQGWAKNVSELTNGQITINLLPVGSIVSHSETQDAIAAGILDGHITDVSYFSGKDPAFGLIANPVGAWSDPHTMLDFMRNGGGGKLMQQLDGEYGLHFIGATTPGLEALVSKVPLDGVADLKGLKIRAPEGLVANVFAAAGAAPVNLPGSEVYTALDKGVIDAADYTVFSTNQAQGLNDIAPNPVYPGFHSLPLVEIAISTKDWDDAAGGPSGQADPVGRPVRRSRTGRAAAARQGGRCQGQGRWQDPHPRLVDGGARQVPHHRHRASGRRSRPSRTTPRRSTTC